MCTSQLTPFKLINLIRIAVLRFHRLPRVLGFLQLPQMAVMHGCSDSCLDAYIYEKTSFVKTRVGQANCCKLRIVAVPKASCFSTTFVKRRRQVAPIWKDTCPYDSPNSGKCSASVAGEFVSAIIRFVHFTWDYVWDTARPGKNKPCHDVVCYNIV